MAPQRYDLRREFDGNWTVFDVFTGWPVEICGAPQVQLDPEDADDLVDLLNLRDVARRFPPGPPRASSNGLAKV